MIAVAKKRYPNCTFIARSYFLLSFANKSMDVIMVSCAFNHFEKPQWFATECMRILKEDGRIYMAEPYFPPLLRWIVNALVFPISRTGDVRVYSSKNLLTFFEKAGFTDIQTYIKDTIQFFAARK